MLINEKKELCSGCYACSNACPKSCITMQVDSEGFWYPHVNEEKCVNCKVCEKICPVFNRISTREFDFPIVYAAINKSEEVVKNSSSGGVFTSIAQYVLQNNGIVFGAAFNEKLEVEHIPIESEQELWKLQGSKYVQSKIGNVYEKVKEYLNQKRLVLFTGTPCQIAGLKSFLGNDYENLICQDIICHGVPSPRVWDLYLKYRKEKAEENIQEIFFRYKIYGWKKYSLLFNFENGKEYISVHRDDDYMKAFLYNYSLRPSCFNCHFKGVNRLADFTLADFWHVNTYAPDMYNENGVSLVFLHTEKAKQIFEIISNKLNIKYIEDENVAKMNRPMVSSVDRPKNRDKFFEKLGTTSFDVLIKKYCKVSIGDKLKRKIVKFISKINFRKGR